MTRPPDPSPRPLRLGLSPEDEALLFDLRRGELDRAGRAALEARLAAEPGLADAAARLARFDVAVQEAHAPAPDAEAALRVALRVREQAAQVEAGERRRARQPTRRRVLWARVIACSIAVHVAVLAFLAFQVRERTGAPAPSRISLHAGLPDPALPPCGPWTADRQVPPPGWSEPGEPRLPEPEGLAADVGREPDASDELPPLEEHRFDHPSGVALDMLVRRFDVFKRRRLDRFGLDPAGTLEVVRRGLGVIAHRQRDDGSFPAYGNRGALGETALALLPFLAEGDGSRTGTRGPDVVAPGVAWIEHRLFASDGLAPGASGLATVELGMALRTLSEDYVLSYGSFSPGEVQERARELRALTALVASRQTKDGGFEGTGDDPGRAAWPMWGMEAAARTGVVAPPSDAPRLFARWLEPREGKGELAAVAVGMLLGRELGGSDVSTSDRSASRNALVRAGADGRLDPFVLAAAGSGLLLEDPDAFRVWNEKVTERILRELDPTGCVRKGDPVGDTALHLLALQAAYRTY